MSVILAPGATSVSIVFLLVDDSGLAVTGKAAATLPAISYVRERSAAVSITLSDLAAVTSAYSSGGVKEVGSGYYRLDVPDAAFATASRVVIVGEASGMHVIYPRLVVQNVQGTLASTDATAARVALALPNAAAGATGGVPVLYNVAGVGLVAAADVQAVQGSAESGGGLASAGSQYANYHAFDLTPAYDAAKTAASQTSVNALPTASAIAAAVWGAGTRTLTGFGTLIADIWAYATRTLTAFAFDTGSLTGPSAVTLTFHDAGGNPVPSVAFTVYSSDLSTSVGFDRAGPDGVASFGLNDGAYKVVATATGFTFPVTALTVSGATAATITGTGASVPDATTPGTCNCFLTCCDGSGNVISGAEVRFKMVALPATPDAGVSFPATEFAATGTGTAVNNLRIQLVRGATYVVYRAGAHAGAQAVKFTVPDSPTYQLRAMLGGA